MTVLKISLNFCVIGCSADAISCLDQAVNIFLDIGRHNMAAKHCKVQFAIMSFT